MRISSVRRRLLASLIDLIVSVFVAVAFVAGGIASVSLRSRFRRRGEGVDRGSIEPPRQWRLSFRQQASLWLGSVGLALLARNRRSLGYRLLRLRRVDMQTSGPVSIRSVLIVQVCDLGWRAMSRRLTRGPLRRRDERLREHDEALKEIRGKYAGDPQGRQQAVASFLEDNPSISPSSCVWPLLPDVLWRLLPALWVRQGRTVRDRVTGTAVVVEP